LARKAAGEEVDGREAPWTPAHTFTAVPRNGLRLWSCPVADPQFPAFGVGHRAGSWPVDVVDVSKSGNIGPVLGEDSLAELIPFDLEPAVPASPFEAKVDPADARE
jgi:hypothetical protein